MLIIAVHKHISDDNFLVSAVLTKAHYLPSVRLLFLQVALKMIRKKDISSIRMRKRLHREVNNMKKLQHSNIIRIVESKCY